MLRLITDLLRNSLGSEPMVRAIFLNGSYVAGTETPDSDIDFTILVEEDDSTPKVLERLGSLFYRKGECHGVPQFWYQNKRLCFTILTEHSLETTIHEVFRSAEDIQRCQAMLQHKVIEAIPLVDPDDLLANYQKRLEEYPDSLAGELTTHALDYLQSEYLDDWSFRNPFHYAWCLPDILDHIGQALYALNKRFHMPPLKRWHRDLQALHPGIDEELSELIRTSEAGSSSQREALGNIVMTLRENKRSEQK